MKQRARKRRSELRVVFDTSVLYTRSGSELLRAEAIEIVRRESKHQDLRVRWYLPEVVVGERRFQMEAKALELLEKVRELEELLGKKLKVTEGMIKDCIGRSVERQMKSLGVEIAPLRVGEVDWDRVIEDAICRVAPFEPGTKEKGFRDALICECFMQVVSERVGDGRRCKVVFVTGDRLLAEAVRGRIEGMENVLVVESLEELRGFVNTLVGNVSEEFVAEMRARAGECFYGGDNRDAVYSRSDVRGKIEAKFREKLGEVPNRGSRRENGKWAIGDPSFERKKGERIYWATRIRVQAKAWVEPEFICTYGGTEVATGPLLEMSGQPGLSGIDVLGESEAPRGGRTIEEWMGGGGPVSPVLPEYLSLARMVEGETVFEVRWSVSVTRQGTLIRPRVGRISYVGTAWGGGF